MAKWRIDYKLYDGQQNVETKMGETDQGRDTGELHFPPTYTTK